MVTKTGLAVIYFIIVNRDNNVVIEFVLMNNTIIPEKINKQP